MMKPEDYIEKAINELLEADERIKAQFYSHAYDDTSIERLHQTHHKIRRWVEQLFKIRDEIVTDGITVEVQSVNKEGQTEDQTVFYIRRRDMQGAASGVVLEQGFRVLRGSYINPVVTPNMYEIVKRLRRENSENINDQNCLIIDIDFDNAGQAARFVTGKQVNGIGEWQSAEGKSLKDCENSTTVYVEKAVNNTATAVIFTSKKPSLMFLFGNEYHVKAWRDVLVTTCEVLYMKNPQVVCAFDSNERLNKKRPNFSWKKEEIKQQPVKLSFGLWIELNHSAQTIMKLCENTLMECGFAISEIKVIVR